MAYRKRVRNKRRDKRTFSRTADRVRAINMPMYQPRGGIRL